MGFFEQHEKDVVLLEKTEEKQENSLIVFNDDVNTFDHVINTLMEVCNHEPRQAEQCTWIIHYKGKCNVKHGSIKKLKPMCTAILDRGINAEILS